MSRKSSNNGKLTVRPHQKQLENAQGIKMFGEGTTILDSASSRSTEDDALKKVGTVPQLDELQLEILTLERIGRDPRNYKPDYPVRDRPYRPIFGSALWAWIGRQPGITMSAKEVEVQLLMISRIEERRAEMGLDTQ